MNKLTQPQICILEHTAYRAAGGYFCGDSTDMQVLVNRGLMISAGCKSFVDDEYFKLTELGREMIGYLLVYKNQSGDKR